MTANLDDEVSELWATGLIEEANQRWKRRHNAK